jgi:predicted MPP superfamily phosphohydrolase
MNIKLTRRGFLGLSLGSAVLGGFYSFVVEPRWLSIRDYVLPTKKWPKGAKPLRIAFASDMHVGCPSVGIEELGYIVEKINKLSADIILLGGDYLIQGVVLGKYMPPGPIAEILSQLKAPLGVYSVLGNHDWWRDGEGMLNALENSGIKVLENNAVKVSGEGYDFWVAGMADDTTRKPDYTKTIQFVSDKEPVIMLAHDPASFMDVGERPVVTLCGHTHGGQVTIPYVSPIVIPGRAPLRYAYGHIHENNRDLIVTGGIGTSILPVRFGRRPEIITVTILSE